jgi:hypothetical protein
MADSKLMDVTSAGVTALDPEAANKFAAVGVPGRVINIDASTDGGGVVEVWLKHPTGVSAKCADVVVPTLKDGEKCALQIRVAASIRKALPKAAIDPVDLGVK